MRVDGDYYFDEFLSNGGASSDGAVVNFLSEKIGTRFAFDGNPFGCSLVGIFVTQLIVKSVPYRFLNEHYERTEIESVERGDNGEAGFVSTSELKGCTPKSCSATENAFISSSPFVPNHASILPITERNITSKTDIIHVAI